MPLHIHASPADIAPVVFLPGDPGRAERIAGRLAGTTCYTRFRGLLGFTGEAGGVRVSVQTTGMGAPSASIIAEELIQLGAKVLVRVGTAGGVGESVRPGDLVIATASCPLDGATRAYLDGEPYAPAAAFTVTRALVDAAAALGYPPHTGLIATEDAFYHPEPGHAEKWAARGVLAFEMEASALFTIAALRRAAAGCLLTVSNTSKALDWLGGDTLDDAIGRMIAVALAAAPALAGIAARLPAPAEQLSHGAERGHAGP
jgi:purine-nucleoside phosphorylase